jgi:septin family protein
MIEDCRIHLVLFFVPASIKNSDYVFMKEISNWTNIIPIIGKVLIFLFI